MSSIDGVTARNNTKVYIEVNGKRVGRVQSFREDITNNVQVLDELGSAYAVELNKGITHYTFTIARFYCQRDVLEPLKLGQIFSLKVRDYGASSETLEYFKHCAIQSISRDFTVGQAVVAENATVVVAGKGLEAPQPN